MLGIKTIKRNKIMQFQKIKNQKEIKLSDLDNTQLLKLILHLYDNKKYEEVIKLSEKINLKTTDQYWIYHLKGLSHLNSRDYDNAINEFKKSLNVLPESANTYLFLGICFHKKQNFENAESYYISASLKKDNYVEAFFNLANLYKDFGYAEKSEKYVSIALKINPNLPQIYNIKGTLSEMKNDLKDAVKHYLKAISLNQSYHEPIFNLSLIYLFSNQFKEGWKFYEKRWHNEAYLNKKMKTDRPYWSPSVSKNHKVTIWPEQGIGDFILMSRFLNDLKNATNHITLLINHKLKPIFARSFPDIEFVTELNKSTIDYHAPIGDLAKFYVNGFEDVKARSDVYLKVDKSRTQKIKQLLPKSKKICGISWVSKNESIGQNKSMSLEDLKDLLLLPNITFVDLQYTDTSEERASFKDRYGVEILKLEEIDNFNDIDGLASLIDACDQVVSVSNTTVHIAGSIGKETYLMLPQGKGRLWYWSKEKEQSIWYKSVQVIEQTQIGCWKNVVENIKNKFKKSALVNTHQYLNNEISILINLFKKGLYDQVIEKGKQVLSKFEKSYMVTNIIGSAYLKLKDFNNAKIYHEKTRDLNRKFSEAYYNLAYTYWQLGQLDLAEKNGLMAIKLQPKYSYAYNVLGSIYEEKFEINKALKSYKKSIQFDNTNLTPKYNLSLMYLHNGDFKLAWKHFETRWKILKILDKVNELSGERWSPDSTSKSVTIWPEQGIGDFILMSRFLNDLKNATNHITLLINHKLKPIFARSFPDIEFVTELNKSTIDYHAPIGDLAKFYVNGFEDVKARSDVYLKVDKSRTQKIKQLLPKSKKICGISWVSKNESIGQNKSMSLEDLKDLLLLPNITFVDLQYTDTSEERASFKDRYGVEILKLEEIDNFNDIDGLASLIDACDQVVSVSNTTVHIAGSIGKETYLMLPQGKGRLWYWSKEKEQSIWYKSVQVIEQTQIGCWKNVVENIKNKLCEV